MKVNIIHINNMKLNLRAILLCSILASASPLTVSASDAVNPSSPAKTVPPLAIQPKTIILDDLKPSKDDDTFLKIIGENISINSDLSTKEKSLELFGKLDDLGPIILWKSVADFQAYTLSGQGIMPRGILAISTDDASIQFTIEPGIKFQETQLWVAGSAKLIFKGEFISNPFMTSERTRYMSVISPEASIDLNEAIFKPEKSLVIEMLAGKMIRDHHSVTKNHEFVFMGNSYVEGNLSIASEGKLYVVLDSLFGPPSILQVSGSLNFESNSCIDFLQYMTSKVELKSGMVIARAASIGGDLSGLVLRHRLYDNDAKYGEAKRSIILKDMKLISVKNGEKYDLILQRIGNEAQK